MFRREEIVMFAVDGNVEAEVDVGVEVIVICCRVNTFGDADVVGDDSVSWSIYTSKESCVSVALLLIRTLLKE